MGVVRVTYVTVFLCALLPAARALGQTTQPAPAALKSPVAVAAAAPSTTTAAAALASSAAPAPWVQVVSDLTDALISDTNSTSSANVLEKLLPDEVKICQFGSPDADTRERLHQQTARLSLVAARAYPWPAETIASDLGSDIQNCDAIPEELRKEFVPRSDDDAKHANITAQQWVFNLLQPAPGQMIGVIVVWDTDSGLNPDSLTVLSTPNAAAAPAPAQNENYKHPIFVLVKGTKVSDANGGKFKITQICYGDARRALGEDYLKRASVQRRPRQSGCCFLGPQCYKPATPSNEDLA